MTACGLEADGRKTARGASDCTCGNCLRILETASPAHGWAKCSNALRAFYFQRAGFLPERAAKLARQIISRWPEADRARIIIQLQSNRVAARAMGLPVKPIKRGGPGDNGRVHAREWLNYQLRKHGHSCPHCGGIV